MGYQEVFLWLAMFYTFENALKLNIIHRDDEETMIKLHEVYTKCVKGLSEIHYYDYLKDINDRVQVLFNARKD